LAPTSLLPAKPATSLTPSDLPSLPSSKKVHKWLVDSTRTSATPLPGAQSPSSPQRKAEKVVPPYQAEYPGPSALPGLNQTDLARELIEVLGSVAAQTLEQQKLLSQKRGQDDGRNKEISAVQTQQLRLRQCEDTPASPGYHDGVCLDPGAVGYRGTGRDLCSFVHHHHHHHHPLSLSHPTIYQLTSSSLNHFCYKPPPPSPFSLYLTVLVFGMLVYCGLFLFIFKVASVCSVDGMKFCGFFIGCLKLL